MDSSISNRVLTDNFLENEKLYIYTLTSFWAETHMTAKN